MRFIYILLLAVLTMSCGDDNTGSTTDNNGINNSIRTKPDMDVLPCSGCFVDGVCESGREPTACGAGGIECVACRGDELCNDDGACQAPPSCTRETCSGCCDENDACITGDGVTACGTGGAFCTACPADAACVEGNCQIGCGPDTCNGCCDVNGQCVTGEQDPTCGTGGGACTDCQAQGTVCGGGACVAMGCSQTCTGCCDGDTCIEAPTAAQCGTGGGACMACTMGQTCTAGACDTVVGSSWSLVILSADVSAWDWDLFSSPDPYVYAYTEDAMFYWQDVTRTKSDTRSPNWDETIMPGMSNEALTTNGLYMELLDEDAFGPETICTYQLTLDAAAFSGNVVESTCSTDPSTVLRWRLVPAP